MPRTPGPTGTRPGNSTSTFRPSRVRATEQVHSGRYPMTAHGTSATFKRRGSMSASGPLSDISAWPAYVAE
jgi:hypothetical protein